MYVGIVESVGTAKDRLGPFNRTLLLLQNTHLRRDDLPHEDAARDEPEGWGRVELAAEERLDVVRALVDGLVECG